MGREGDSARIPTGCPILSAPAAELSVGQALERELQLRQRQKRIGVCAYRRIGVRTSNFLSYICTYDLSSREHAVTPTPPYADPFPPPSRRHPIRRSASPDCYRHSCLGYLRCNSCLIFG